MERLGITHVNNNFLKNNEVDNKEKITFNYFASGVSEGASFKGDSYSDEKRILKNVIDILSNQTSVKALMDNAVTVEDVSELEDLPIIKKMLDSNRGEVDVIYFKGIITKLMKNCAGLIDSEENIENKDEVLDNFIDIFATYQSQLEDKVFQDVFYVIVRNYNITSALFESKNYIMTLIDQIKIRLPNTNLVGLIKRVIHMYGVSNGSEHITNPVLANDLLRSYQDLFEDAATVCIKQQLVDGCTSEIKSLINVRAFVNAEQLNQLYNPILGKDIFKELYGEDFMVHIRDKDILAAQNWLEKNCEALEPDICKGMIIFLIDTHRSIYGGMESDVYTLMMVHKFHNIFQDQNWCRRLIKDMIKLYSKVSNDMISVTNARGADNLIGIYKDLLGKNSVNELKKSLATNCVIEIKSTIQRGQLNKSRELINEYALLIDSSILQSLNNEIQAAIDKKMGRA